MLVCVSMEALGFPLIIWHQQTAHLTNQPCVMPAQTRLTAFATETVWEDGQQKMWLRRDQDGAWSLGGLGGAARSADADVP